MAIWTRKIRGKQRYHGSRNLPPILEKNCIVCEEKTMFKYNQNIGHSECTVCGWRNIPRIKSRRN